MPAPRVRSKSGSKGSDVKWIPLGLCAIAAVFLLFQWNAPSPAALHPDSRLAKDVRLDEHSPTSAEGHAEKQAAAGGVSQLGCHMEQHNEYHGAVVAAGTANKQETWEACCQECRDTDQCNVWVYCDQPAGCAGSPQKECWLKKGDLPALLGSVIGKPNPGITWMSGALLTDDVLAAHEASVAAKESSEKARLRALKEDATLPLVWMDVEIDGQPAGRIEAVLFAKESPFAAENYRVFFSGERGPPYTYKGATFYRIIDRFIDQTGVNAAGSIYGHQFKDDAGGLQLKHDRPYLLSIANSGPNTNTNHFSVLVAPAPHLNTHYVIFGECVSGLDVAEKINKLAVGQPNNEVHAARAVISDCGQTRKGDPIVTEGA